MHVALTNLTYKSENLANVRASIRYPQLVRAARYAYSYQVECTHFFDDKLLGISVWSFLQYITLIVKDRTPVSEQITCT